MIPGWIRSRTPIRTDHSATISARTDDAAALVKRPVAVSNRLEVGRNRGHMSRTGRLFGRPEQDEHRIAKRLAESPPSLTNLESEPSIQWKVFTCGARLFHLAEP